MAAIVVGGLAILASPSAASENSAHRVIGEREIRAASAKRDSELLRLACLNGWRFRESDVESGFRRSYGELKLVFADQGYAILPDPVSPELIVATIPMVDAARSSAAPELGCFRARWSRNR